MRFPKIVPLRRSDEKKYAGQWVAVKEGKVVLAAPTAEELLELLKKSDVKDTILFQLPPEGARWSFAAL